MPANAKPFRTLRRAMLPMPIMCMAILLACFACFMHLSTLLSPLWLKNPSFGHGVCVYLQPIAQAHNQHIISHLDHADMVAHSHQQMSPHTHQHDSMTQAIHKTDDVQHDSSHDASSHECDICSSMSAFAMGYDLPIIIKNAMAMYSTQIATQYKYISLLFIEYLLPPTRAPPAFHHFISIRFY
ncbi:MULTISPECIES: hypothetical protein [unclassified Acinetobacter]|uniref:hypothetical protein n=1 Tax=unclassified Acinetobacter TaxID=196816 RepID=UPI0035B96C7D